MKEFSGLLRDSGSEVWGALLLASRMTGLFQVIISLLLAFIIYKVFRRFNFKTGKAPILIVIISLLVLSLFGYGIFHLINPYYFALKELRNSLPY